MDGQMDGWTDGQTDGPTDQQTNRLTDYRTDGLMDRQTDGQTDRQTVTCAVNKSQLFYKRRKCLLTKIWTNFLKIQEKY